MTMQKKGFEPNESSEIVVILNQARDATIYTEENNTQVMEHQISAAFSNTFVPQVETVDRSDR